MVRVVQSSIPHVKWIDLKGDGVMVECAVLKEDNFGNIYYVEIGSLDHIDKARISKIVNNRNAQNFELWDLMSQITLNNGVNALDYFHQLVKVITAEGVIMNPRVGAVGTGKLDTNSREQMASVEMNATVESVPEESTPQKRGRTKTKKQNSE